MVAFPLAVIFFFTSLLEQGQPQEMPVGVVDLDNTSTTRTLIRTLDAFQSCEVVAHYATPAEAREAIENNKIYGFLYIPEGTTEKLIASRQPKISFYYTMTTIMSGSLVYRDMKTVATLGSAALGMATMRAKGLTDKQIKTLMQPIAIDLHQIGNPTTDYNAYLTTVMVPGILMLFIFLITAYAIAASNWWRWVSRISGCRSSESSCHIRWYGSPSPSFIRSMSLASWSFRIQVVYSESFCSTC